MKLAIISDIHSNPAALETVLADTKAQGCDRVVCLGDIVGYGYDPTACIDICREKAISCILGNHDAGLIGKLGLSWFSSTAHDGIMRQRPLVDEDRRKWLYTLPYSIREEFGAWRVCFAHGSFSYPEEFEYISSLMDASREMSFMSMRGCDILFVGHTHYAEAYGLNYDDGYCNFDTVNASDLTINPNGYKTLIVNVGSVGYPRNQPQSFYVIFDTEEQRIHYRSLPFDFRGYVVEMQKKDIPIPLWVEEYEYGQRPDPEGLGL